MAIYFLAMRSHLQSVYLFVVFLSLFFTVSSTSLMVNGSGTPRVSGSKNTKNPDISEIDPITIVGNCALNAP